MELLHHVQQTIGLACQVMRSGAVIKVIADRTLQNTLFVMRLLIAVFAERYVD